MLETVIFDIDGTLIDSVDLHANAWCDAFRHFDVEVSFEVVRKRIGKGADELMPDFVEPALLQRIGEPLKTYRTKLFHREYLPRVTAFPKVRELFEDLKGRGKRIALASSCERDELREYTHIDAIENLSDIEVCSDDARHSKPHPDIFLAALTKLGEPSRDSVVAVGDTPYDAIAARGARLRTIGVLCGGTPVDVLVSAGCSLVFQDPADLLNRFPESAWLPEE